MRRRRTAEDADLILLNTCHIREKAAEKVYSELGRLRRLKARQPRAADRRRRLRRAGRGRGNPGAGAGGRPRGGAAGLSPAAGPDRAARGGRAAGGDRVPGRGQVRPSAAGPAGAAGAGGVPDGAGGLRQVLRLLRRALHPRRGGVAAGGAGRGGGARAGGARRRRDHAARAERERLPRRATAWGSRRWSRRLAAIEGLERIRYTTSHPNDMERRADRGAWRRRRS